MAYLDDNNILLNFKSFALNWSAKTMGRNELIEPVERIISARDTEEKLHNLMEQIEMNVSYPKIVDYLYGKEYEDLTPAQIIDKALNYKPFYQ